MHHSTLCLTFCLWLLLKGAQYSYRLVGGGASSDHHMILTHFSPTLELQRFNYMYMWMGRNYTYLSIVADICCDTHQAVILLQLMHHFSHWSNPLPVESDDVDI